MRKFLIAALVLFAATPALAQSRQIALRNVQNRPAELSQGGASYADMLGAALDAIAPFFPDGCTRMEGESLLFADIGNEDELTRHIVSQGLHIYRERVLVTACGRQFMPNYYVVQRAGERPIFALGTPGETIASVQLQRNVEPPIRRAASAATGCQDENATAVLHTSVEHYPSQPNAPWRELWTVRACERRAEVPVDFTPDATAGVTFNIRTTNIRISDIQ